MCCCRKKKQLFITKVPARRSCNKPRNISRKERQNRRLPVKIIRKSVYLFPPNLATLRLGASSFRLRIRSASRSFAQVTQISTCTKSTKFRSLNISILPFVRFAVSILFTKLLTGRFELRQPNVFGGLLECNRDFHAEFNVFNGTIHNVGDHARTFVQIHPGYHVGDVRLEGLRCGASDYLTNYGERINLALATHFGPLDTLAAAFVAQRARGPNPCAAVVAMLHDEFILRRGVPKGFRFGGDRRQGFSNVYVCHEFYASLPNPATAQQPRFLP